MLDEELPAEVSGESKAEFEQDEGIDVHGATPPNQAGSYAPDVETMGVVRTLDGEDIDDEFAQDAYNYQILLGKIDTLLDRLKLDA